MPDIGKGCHELRVQDETRTWRILYHLDVDAVVILEVFAKTGRATPALIMKSCKSRLRRYLAAADGKETKK